MENKLKEIIKKHIKDLVQYWTEIYVSETKDEEGDETIDRLTDKELNQWAEETLKEIEIEYNKEKEKENG